MRVLLIEDELPARRKLKSYLERYDPNIVVCGEGATLSETCALLSANPAPDLILSDIELLDGNVFEVYRQVAPKCPVIFATAYNQYWMDAFQHSGIEYLLKPYTFERFAQAMDKYGSLKASFAGGDSLLQKLNALVQASTPASLQYKTRFSVKLRDGIYPLEAASIAWLESDNGVIKAIDEKGKTWLLQETGLHELEARLDPTQFFRINRSELVQLRFIQKAAYHTKDRLSVHLSVQGKVLFTSQSRTASFRQWLEG